MIEIFMKQWLQLTCVLLEVAVLLIFRKQYLEW